MFCRFLRGHKGYSKIQRLADYQTAQLDIRNLISNSIALKDYFRCSLTQEQRVLIARQRSRVAQSDDNQKKEATECNDIDTLSLAKFDDEAYLAALTNFTPKNSFERELVKGVLYRNGRISNIGSLKCFNGNGKVEILHEANLLR